jgi:hypothetical protein
MNILIKLTSIVSLIIAPFIANWYLLKDEVVVEEAPVAVIEEVVVEEAAAAVEEATIELEEAAAQVVDEK